MPSQPTDTALGNHFVSGGRNPNWQKTCEHPQCRFLEKAPPWNGGFCTNPHNRVAPCAGWPNGFTPSVSSTGGCDEHEGL